MLQLVLHGLHLLPLSIEMSSGHSSTQDLSIKDSLYPSLQVEHVDTLSTQVLQLPVHLLHMLFSSIVVSKGHLSMQVLSRSLGVGRD